MQNTVANDDCEACPVGTYSDAVTGANQPCTVCISMYTTAGNGSDTSADCLRKSIKLLPVPCRLRRDVILLRLLIIDIFLVVFPQYVSHKIKRIVMTDSVFFSICINILLIF